MVCDVVTCIPKCDSEMYVAIDVLVRGPMKRSAKCDTHCELYDSVNRQQREHTL